MYPHDNIFSIYYNIGKRTPFVVKRVQGAYTEEFLYSPMGRTFMVEKVVPKGKYGKAYGYCMIDGVRSDDCEYMQSYKDLNGEIPCGGCGEWVLIDVPGVDMDEVFPVHHANDILVFGKHKGKTFKEVYILDEQYLHWLETTDKYFRIDFDEIVSMIGENTNN